jgi:tRNA (guanosine-2'-O-)-methyltransferase
MDEQLKKSYLEYLLQFVTQNKRNRFEEIIRNRTRHLTVALEDIYQSHNASAVLRTCDCFGIQDVHIIENKYKYTLNPDIALGASQWLCLEKYNQREDNTADCLA